MCLTEEKSEKTIEKDVWMSGEQSWAGLRVPSAALCSDFCSCRTNLLLWIKLKKLKSSGVLSARTSLKLKLLLAMKAAGEREEVTCIFEI